MSDQSEMSIRELVARASSGDLEAFGTLVKRSHPRLQSIVHVRLGNSLRRFVGVDDVLQDAYLRAFQSIGGFSWRGEGSFYQWLARIVENVLRDLARHHLHARKRGGAPRTEERRQRVGGALGAGGSDVRDFIDANVISPSRVLRRKERLERLENALAELPHDQREVVILARILGLPMRRVAARLGRSREAASMLLLRALRRLRELFGSTQSLSLPDANLEDLLTGSTRFSSSRH